LLDHPITLSSVVGRGSNFSITVPIGEKVRIESPRPSGNGESSWSLVGKSIFCVEDQAEVLSGLEALLVSWGCRTQGYVDAARAIDDARLKSTSVDLIIVDYHLGREHQGIDVARKLRDIWDKDVPVIVITAADLRDHHLNANDGVVRIVRKPIRPGALRALMDVVLT
jgi:CheY-like chemotaxis protein